MPTLKHAVLIASSMAITSLFTLHASAAEAKLSKPAVMSKQDIAGDIFKRPDMIIEKRDNGTQVLDVVSLLSSDKKFVSGMYKAPAGRFEVTEPYGVDEYMYFLEGGVTLTSSDGTVTEIKAGDAVTLAKEWTGIWDTQGYTKIYVIYSPDKPMD
ncbi:cupin domain-containing protein [Dasania marina]|uniref:cupin domain-containing protein n=1 Tax=Dasania marina TaxID=471499 RepID=UPI0004B1C622|nr:cupin domain-containing protein [Dasania marina]